MHKPTLKVPKSNADWCNREQEMVSLFDNSEEDFIKFQHLVQHKQNSIFLRVVLKGVCLHNDTIEAFLSHLRTIQWSVLKNKNKFLV